MERERRQEERERKREQMREKESLDYPHEWTRCEPDPFFITHTPLHPSANQVI